MTKMLDEENKILRISSLLAFTQPLRMEQDMT